MSDERPDLEPGQLLSAVPVTGAAALPGAAVTLALRYVSSTDTGSPIVVSGLVSLPRGHSPKGGWPVVSWAHGTTGVAPVCQPSQDSATGPAHDYLGRIDLTLTYWVARGFVVAQTDYETVGGIQPYLNGIDESNDVIDIVRAARHLGDAVGRTWLAGGQSQGGQAALFTAARAEARAPELKFLGAVVMAPASHTGDIVSALVNNVPGAAAGIPFLPLIILGAQVTNPAIQPDQLLTPTGLQLVALAKQGCIAQLRAASTNLTIPEVLNVTSPNWATLQQTLAAQEPANFPPQVPIFIAQGLADTLVAPTFTNGLVASLCAAGTPLEYFTYPGVDHRGSVEASFVDYSNWIQQRLAGVTPPTTCP